MLMYLGNCTNIPWASNQFDIQMWRGIKIGDPLSPWLFNIIRDTWLPVASVRNKYIQVDTHAGDIILYVVFCHDPTA